MVEFVRECLTEVDRLEEADSPEVIFKRYVAWVEANKPQHRANHQTFSGYLKKCGEYRNEFFKKTGTRAYTKRNSLGKPEMYLKIIPPGEVPQLPPEEEDTFDLG